MALAAGARREARRQTVRASDRSRAPRSLAARDALTPLLRAASACAEIPRAFLAAASSIHLAYRAPFRLPHALLPNPFASVLRPGAVLLPPAAAVQQRRALPLRDVAASRREFVPAPVRNVCAHPAHAILPLLLARIPRVLEAFTARSHFFRDLPLFLGVTVIHLVVSFVSRGAARSSGCAPEVRGKRCARRLDDFSEKYG